MAVQLANEFTVPVSAADAWRVLMDVQRIGPCLPGAAIERVEGDEIVGRVKVKLGPITASYYGTARFVEKDEAGRRFVLEGKGRETRGSGTASATITGQLHDEGASTRVTVQTDLDITGKPAQFGRGVLSDVAANLIKQFASCLADEITAPVATTSTAGAQPTPERPGADVAAGARLSTRSEAGALELIGTVGMPVLKRLAPVLAGLAVVVGWALTRQARPRVVVVHVHLPSGREAGGLTLNRTYPGPLRAPAFELRYPHLLQRYPGRGQRAWQGVRVREGGPARRPRTEL
jgi:carbon monoxide dehydrogenase subunit G